MILNPSDGAFDLETRAIHGPLPTHYSGLASRLVVDVAEPDAAPTGDRWPCHFFEPDVDWPLPLPPVLRADRAPAGSLLDALSGWVESDLGPSSGFTVRPLLDHFGVPDATQSGMLRSPGLRARLLDFWGTHHEWVTVAVLVSAALLAAFFAT